MSDTIEPGEPFTIDVDLQADPDVQAIVGFGEVQGVQGWYAVVTVNEKHRLTSEPMETEEAAQEACSELLAKITEEYAKHGIELEESGWEDIHPVGQA